MAKTISQDKLLKLNKLGYRGDANLDSLMDVLNKKHIHNGDYMQGEFSWWSVIKDKDNNKNKDFIDGIADYLEESLKDGSINLFSLLG